MQLQIGTISGSGIAVGVWGAVPPGPSTFYCVLCMQAADAAGHVQSFLGGIPFAAGHGCANVGGNLPHCIADAADFCYRKRKTGIYLVQLPAVVCALCRRALLGRELRWRAVFPRYLLVA